MDFNNRNMKNHPPSPVYIVANVEQSMVRQQTGKDQLKP